MKKSTKSKKKRKAKERPVTPDKGVTSADRHRAHGGRR